MPHDLAVLTCPWLTLVSIHHEVARSERNNSRTSLIPKLHSTATCTFDHDSPSIRWLVHKAPLQAGGKPRPTTPPETRLLYLVQYPIMTFQQYLLRLIPVTLQGKKRDTMTFAGQFSDILHPKGGTCCQMRKFCAELTLKSLYPAQSSLQLPVMSAVEVGEDPVLILQTTVRTLLGREREAGGGGGGD